MKYSNIVYFVFFLLLIIFVSICFQWCYREGLVNIDPTIVNSNIPYGPLSNNALSGMLQDLANQASKIKITKINIVGDDSIINKDNNYIPPANAPNNATISLNGRNIGPIANNTNQLASLINMLTRSAKSIDIQYITS